MKALFFVATVALMMAANVVEASPSATASHILVKTEEECESLKTKIQEGGDFAAEAKEHSKCPSGKNGGSLGNFRQGQMVPEFDKVIFSKDTKMGEVYGPVKTQFGYHLIKVFKRSGVNGEESA